MMHKRIDHLDNDPRAALWGGSAAVELEDFRRLPVLMIVHQLQSTPGHVGNWFLANGFKLDIRRPRFGDPLPETLEGHAGAVIFGGPQSANDTDDFIRREIDWISVALSEQKPFLGICLGAQMLALHLGGQVRAHAGGCVEHGYYSIKPTPAGSAVLDWPEHVYQWHREGFTTPETSILLATSDYFPHQAFRNGAAFALQFHPEITQMVMNRWVTRSGYRLVMPGARPGPAHRSEHLLYGPPQRFWLGDFLSKWVRVAIPKALA